MGAQLMKGKVWGDYAHKVRFPVFVEPKIDEIRVHVKIENEGSMFLSYAGKPLANMQFFAYAFTRLAYETGQKEFDCGILVNGNFNDSYRWVRSTRGVPDDLVDAEVEFSLYDLPGLPYTYKLRRPIIQRFAYQLDGYLRKDYPTAMASAPNAVLCAGAREVEEQFLYYRSRGLEGAMVKNPEHVYQRGKRTADWLKLKPENDADGVVIEIIEAVCGKDQPELGLREGDKLGRAGSVRLRMEDGSEACAHGIPHDLGRDMWVRPEKYISQWAEMKYMERDRQGGYRHPTFHRLREGKE